MKNTSKLKTLIREVNDFPTPGTKFYDITPLLEDPEAFKGAIDDQVAFFKEKKVNKVVGIDARGFILAAPIAYLLGAGLVLVRKKGKLPHKILVEHHTLEYGKARLEIHKDSINKGDRVAIIDDVLATGGTAKAGATLVEKLGGEIVGIGFLLEIDLGGREKFLKYDVFSSMIYDK